MYDTVVSKPIALKTVDVINEETLKEELIKEIEQGKAASQANNYSQCVTHISKALDLFKKYDYSINQCIYEGKSNLTLQGETNVADLGK